MDSKRIKYLRSQLGKTSIQDLKRNGYLRLEHYIAAGFSAKELKAAGFVLDDVTFQKLSADPNHLKYLLDAGYQELDFNNIKIYTSDLRRAGFSYADLFNVGWNATNMQLPKEVLEVIAVANESKGSSKNSVPISMLKSAGFSIKQMKKAGFSAATLKTEGAWDSKEDIKLVDDLYGEDEIWKEIALLKKTRSTPISLEQIGKARDSYLKAVKSFLESRDSTRIQKKKKVQLERRLKKARDWKDKLKQKKVVTDSLIDEKKKLDEAIDERDKKKKEVDDKRDKLISIIDQRIEHLKFEIKFQKKNSIPIRTKLNDEIRSLKNAYGKISVYNHKLVQQNYPLTKISPGLRGKRIEKIETTLGVPENVKFSELTNPAIELVPSKSNPKKKEWVSTEGDRYKDNPLEYLTFLEAKKEKVEWIISDHEAEIELLENVKDIAKNAKSLWKPIASQSVYYTLLGLARYTTTEVGMPSLLPSKKSDLSPIKWRRITGKIDFNLEIGASVGVGSSVAATASVGLNIALTGSLAVEDDRRVRARLSIKLIPNFEVKVHPGGALSVAKASAKFGFTITSQAMAFVDEKHFAHYILFRIANIRNFQDKLMEYGAKGLDYDHNPYSDTIKKIMQDQLGGEKTSKYYEEQRLYLTQKPVIKAHMPIEGKIRPTVDLGAESGVIGLKTGIAAQMKTPMYFQKNVLALPDTSSKNAKQASIEEYKGPEYWEYKAAPDGDCAFHSLAFLFNLYKLKEDTQDNPYTADQLRDIAAKKIEKLYQDNEHINSAVWIFDSELYSSVHEYVGCIKSGGTDDTGKHRRWADLPVITALAVKFDCEIHIHEDNMDVIILPPNPSSNAKVIHLAFRNHNHYNPLIEKVTIEPPIDTADLPPSIKDTDPKKPVHFIESGYVDTPKVARLDKRKPRNVTASELINAKRELRQKYTPRIVTLGRMGNSMSLGGSVSFESWVNISLEGTLSSINNHINPDNDGKYLNVKTKADLLQRTFAAEPTGSPQVGDPMGRDALGDVWSKSAPPSNLGLNSLGSALGPVELKTNFMSRFMEWNYVWDGGFYRKQYRRYCYTSGMSIGVSGEVDVYPGFVAGLSFSFGFSKTVTMSESIGDNTLTYLQTVFNGLKSRPNGKKQWDAFLKKHSSSLRTLYRKIGKSSKGEYKKLISKKVTTKNAYKRALELESLVRDNKNVWENSKLEKSDFCLKRSDEDNECFFIKACDKFAANLKVSRGDRIKGGLRAKYKKVPKEMDELNERLTTLLCRSGVVLTLYNERMNPFKRKVRYLVPAKGHIQFNATLVGNSMQLIQAPIIVVPRKKSKAEWVRYKSVADIWMNPNLRWAEDALAFYRAGFLIDLVLTLPHGAKKTISVHPMGSVTSDNENDKDNNDLFQDFFMNLAKDAVNKRKGNLDDFAALVKIDSELEKIFTPWISNLGKGADTTERSKILHIKQKVKAKNNYPETKPGMELLPRGKELLALDKNDNVIAIPPSQAKDNDGAKSIVISDDSSLVQQYGVQNIKEEEKKDQDAEREKWVKKAYLLWQEWVTKKEKDLDAKTGGAGSNVEFILSQIKGPFPGYSDDNEFFQEVMESQRP